MVQYTKEALKKITLHVQRKCTKLITDFPNGSTQMIKNSVKKKSFAINKYKLHDNHNGQVIH